jgi:hypothetical protein
MLYKNYETMEVQMDKDIGLKKKHPTNRVFFFSHRYNEYIDYELYSTFPKVFK